MALEHSRDSYDANVKRTPSTLFQKRGWSPIRTNFSIDRMSSSSRQAIRDTLPILLGVSSNDRYELESKVAHSAAGSEDQQQESWSRHATPSTCRMSRLSASTRKQRRSGSSATPAESECRRDHRSIEVGASNLEARNVPDDDGSRVSRLEDELAQLRQDRRDIQARIDAARQFANVQAATKTRPPNR